jgi:hypothetical protein
LTCRAPTWSCTRSSQALSAPCGAQVDKFEHTSGYQHITLSRSCGCCPAKLRLGPPAGSSLQHMQHARMPLVSVDHACALQRTLPLYSHLCFMLNPCPAPSAVTCSTTTSFTHLYSPISFADSSGVRVFSGGNLSPADRSALSSC